MERLKFYIRDHALNIEDVLFSYNYSPSLIFVNKHLEKPVKGRSE